MHCASTIFCDVFFVYNLFIFNIFGDYVCYSPKIFRRIERVFAELLYLCGKYYWDVFARTQALVGFQV